MTSTLRESRLSLRERRTKSPAFRNHPRPLQPHQNRYTFVILPRARALPRCLHEAHLAAPPHKNDGTDALYREMLMHVIRRLKFGHAAILVCFCLLGATSGRAQQTVLDTEGYITPPKEIHDAVLATQRDHVILTNLCPDGRKFLVTKSDGPPTLARLACPCVYLAEMAFDPVACRARQLWVRSDVGYELFFHADKRTVPVQVPAGARVSNPLWSPDGSRLAFFVHFPDATHICIADTETGSSRRLTQTPVLATLVTTFQWSRDGRSIQTVLLPDDGRRPMPKPNGVATEPKVRVAKDGKNPSRTYRYLLESPHDMRLLEHLVTGQVAVIDVADGKVTKIGFPNMVRSVSMAPGEQHFKVAAVKKPFSYYVPFTRFGAQEMICNLEAKCLHTLSDRALQMTEPQPVTDPTQPKTGFKGKKKGGGAAPATQPTPPTTLTTQPDPDPDPNAPRRPPAADPDGKRDLGWRNDGAGMTYLQLEPVNPKDDKAPRKDRVMLWHPPFGKDDVKLVYKTPH